ncbi:SRPBCC family protein [Nocardioides mesophilus]|uniref:SRPBCC family protein n=1 Tax=Nocardioides mesophilus TaxID=433659 RepID=A0A7G9RCX8_9ACTN|nr:SRPBCC family protein [Nocardioides mesophilus]QNN53453.1 SRPBCC family protein [Nocardioides mesophilus]
MQTIAHIEAPVDRVFDFFVDPRKLADLNPVSAEIRELRMTEEGTGTYAAYRTKIAGVPFEIFDVYTDVVPNKHITEKSSSAMVGTWKYDFEPEGTGTKVTLEHRSRSIWGVPPLGYLGDLLTARLTESFMRGVKERIEASSN